VDGDFYPTGTFELSADKPFMCGNVLGEFSTNGSQLAGKQDPKVITQEFFDLYYLPGITEEEALARMEEKYGDRTEEVAEAYKEAYPQHELCDELFTSSRTNALATAMAEYGGTVYQYVQAYDLPYMGGTTACHTAGDIPFFFRTVTHSDLAFFLAGDEECGLKVMDEMSTALVNFAYTGDPSQDGLAWAAFTVENGETMVFDRVSEVRNYHDKAYMDLRTEILSATN